jgi:hypothetical protein
MRVRGVLNPALAIGAAGVLAATLGATATGPWHPPASSELLVPASWAGQWRFRVEYRRLSTGSLFAAEQGVETICPNDPVGLSLYAGAGGDAGSPASCEASIGDAGLEVTCEPHISAGSCSIDFRIGVSAMRHLDSLEGTGEWRVVSAAGDCDDVLARIRPERILISATRSGTDLTACAGPPSSLVEKMLSQPALIAMAPRPIADLEARADGPTVRLTWSAIPEAAAYAVYRAAGHDAYREIAAVPSRHRPGFRDIKLAEDTTYRYVVRWIAADGRQSPVSNDVSATPRVGRAHAQRGEEAR